MSEQMMSEMHEEMKNYIPDYIQSYNFFLTCNECVNVIFRNAFMTKTFLEVNEFTSQFGICRNPCCPNEDVPLNKYYVFETTYFPGGNNKPFGYIYSALCPQCYFGLSVDAVINASFGPYEEPITYTPVWRVPEDLVYVINKKMVPVYYADILLWTGGNACSFLHGEENIILLQEPVGR